MVEEVRMSSQNEMKLIFDARSVNEGFARVAVAAFIAELNPTLDEIADIKTAVSEAVTNAIIHGYHEPEQKVELLCQICGDEVSIICKDTGRWGFSSLSLVYCIIYNCNSITDQHFCICGSNAFDKED